MAKGKTNNGVPLFNGKESNKGQGFDNNPQNINKNGRPVSIRNQIKELLEKDGEITIPPNQVVKINDDGSITIKLPTQMQMAMKLSSWAMSRKGNDSLKAIQIIMEQIDGKPKQEIDNNHKFTGMDIGFEEPEVKKRK